MVQAGPYHGGWGLPASAATEPYGGVGGASVSTAPVVCDASGLGSCDSRHRLLFSGPLFFGRRVMFNRQGRPRPPCPKKLHSLPSSIRRIIQTRGHSCVDPGPSRRAANSVMRRNRRTVRALLYACMLELIASRMQPVISTCHKRIAQARFDAKKKLNPLAKDDRTN